MIIDAHVHMGIPSRPAFGNASPYTVEDLLRELTPQVLGALVRRNGQFEGCEDAVQEAVLAASVQWPEEGVPDNPRGWLMTVASRRLIDQIRPAECRNYLRHCGYDATKT